MEDMREYFSQLDAVAASQPMPPEFKGWSAKVRPKNFPPLRPTYPESRP
jgi:hypothetical protein